MTEPHPMAKQQPTGQPSDRHSESLLWYVLGGTAMQVVIATVMQVVRRRLATPECCTIGPLLRFICASTFSAVQACHGMPHSLSSSRST